VIRNAIARTRSTPKITTCPTVPTMRACAPLCRIGGDEPSEQLGDQLAALTTADEGLHVLQRRDRLLALHDHHGDHLPTGDALQRIAIGSLGFADQVRLVSVVAAPLGEPVEGGPEMVASESGLLDDQVLRLGSICRGHAVSVSRSGFEDLPHPLAGPGGHDAPEGGCTLSGMGSGMPTMTDHAGSGRRVGDRSCNRAPRLNTGYAWPRLNIDRRAYRPAGRYGRAYSGPADGRVRRWSVYAADPEIDRLLERNRRTWLEPALDRLARRTARTRPQSRSRYRHAPVR
jgi:hypothetical protein